MNLENIIDEGQQTSWKKTNTARFHLDEVARVIRLFETENRMAAGWCEERRVAVQWVQFHFYKMRSVAHDVIQVTLLYCKLKTDQYDKFHGVCFYHNKHKKVTWSLFSILLPSTSYCYPLHNKQSDLHPALAPPTGLVFNKKRGMGKKQRQ